MSLPQLRDPFESSRLGRRLVVRAASRQVAGAGITALLFQVGGAASVNVPVGGARVPPRSCVSHICLSTRPLDPPVPQLASGGSSHAPLAPACPHVHLCPQLCHDMKVKTPLADSTWQYYGEDSNEARQGGTQGRTGAEAGARCGVEARRIAAPC